MDFGGGVDTDGKLYDVDAAEHSNDLLEVDGPAEVLWTSDKLLVFSFLNFCFIFPMIVQLSVSSLSFFSKNSASSFLSIKTSFDFGLVGSKSELVTSGSTKAEGCFGLIETESYLEEEGLVSVVKLDMEFEEIDLYVEESSLEYPSSAVGILSATLKMDFCLSVSNAWSFLLDFSCSSLPNFGRSSFSNFEFKKDVNSWRLIRTIFLASNS